MCQSTSVLNQTLKKDTFALEINSGEKKTICDPSPDKRMKMDGCFLLDFQSKLHTRLEAHPINTC